MVSCAHLDLKIIVNQDVIEGNWGQINKMTGDLDVAIAGSEESEVDGKHGTI
jgi:hypothetical protein